jgi:hypothetical protein
VHKRAEEEGALTLVGRYVATTSLTLAIGPGFPFSAPMSPIGVMLEDDCRSEMGVGNGGGAAGSKMFGYPGSSRGSCDSRFRDSKTSQLPSLLVRSGIGSFVRVHLASRLVRSFFSILLQCLYLIPSFIFTLRTLLLVTRPTAMSTGIGYHINTLPHRHP